MATIANMYGPDFLWLYAGVIVCALGACWALLYLPGGGAEPPRPVSQNPDPYEIAYLRGGEIEVGRLALIELIEEGWLHEKVGGSMGKPSAGAVLRRADTPPSSYVAASKHKLLEQFSGSAHTARAALKLDGFRAAVADLVRPFASQCERFLVPKDSRNMIVLPAAVIVLGLGAFKFSVALAAGRSNVGFLLIFAAAASFGLWRLGTMRLNRAGQEHLSRLQEAFEEMRIAPIEPGSDSREKLMLRYALYGAAAIGSASIAHAAMLGLNPNQSSAWDSSSSSCGDSGGDSGCGGGCGGCGGGE